MTDATNPGGTEREESGADRGPGRPREDVPGAPGSDEPMTDSTDGGLEGGDPGVEE